MGNSKSDELNNIQKKIDLKKKEFLAINKEFKTRDEKKRKLWKEIVDRNKTIERKKQSKTKLNSEIGLLNIKNNQLLKKNEDLIKDIASNNEINSDLLNEIKKLKKEIKNWENKSNLYTNDIEGISKSNKNEKTYYLIGAIFFILLMIASILIPIYQVLYPLKIDWLENSKIFNNQPQLSFYIIMILRFSTVVLSLIVIFIFLNLMKNFISQFIKTEARMNTIRSILFLTERVVLEENDEFTSHNFIELKRKSLEKQVEILNNNIPSILSSNTSSFDKKEQVPWFNFMKSTKD